MDKIEGGDVRAVTPKKQGAGISSLPRIDSFPYI